MNTELVRDAYVYLLGRALIVRQEIIDIAEEGVDYNTIKHNPVGQPIGWANPNLDVANTEAWIAVDAETPALLEIPHIEGRYYTAQILDEWGEVITNINERNYPLHPDGTFAFVQEGSAVRIPDGAERIELRSPKAKMLARVEIRGDMATAAELQHRITLRSLGTPDIAAPVPLPPFDNADLIGVEIFDHAEALCTTAPDVSPAANQMRAKVRHVADLAAGAARDELEAILRNEVIPGFKQFATTGAGSIGNRWFATTTVGNYGEDVDVRAAANYVGIWANATHEAVYFVGTRDANGEQLTGEREYVLDFTPDGDPDAVVDAYWSLSLVDIPDFLAVPNRLERYTFNGFAPPPREADGSLRIYLARESSASVPEPNWLPCPDGPFALNFRTYCPKGIVRSGNWFPPAASPL